VTLRFHTSITSILMMLCLTAFCAAEGKYFEKHLTLPDFPGFDVFVQEVTKQQAAKAKPGERWSLSAKPHGKSGDYLLVGPKKDLWITISVLHTPYGGKKPITSKKFTEEFSTRVKATGADLKTQKDLKSKHAGTVGYYYLTDKTKKHATRLLYVPGALHGNYGDKRAFLIGVTHTAASADRGKALLQKILDNVKVSK
jgi:hypothetical protein